MEDQDQDPIPPSGQHYYQDETGQWWYDPPGKAHRSRCKIKHCVQCDKDFVISTYAAAKAKFCSKTCFGLSRRGALEYGRGESARTWKGGRIIRRGYVLIYAPDHHSIVGRGTKRKYVLEHRLVMEEKLGRVLAPAEHVHHINGVRDDNRIENLELWTTGHSTPGVRVDDVKHCPTCTCVHHQAVEFA